MAEQGTVNPWVAGSSPASPAMKNFIYTSILFPGSFEPDLRPLIILVAIMISSIYYVIKKNWNDIKDDFDSDWE